MGIYKQLQEHKWFLFGLVALGWIIMINHFPAGYIILGGDVLQPINMKEQFANFHYGWFAGRVSLFYGIFYLLSVFGISETAQISWYLGIFLFSAYISFFLFCRVLFPGVGKGIAAALSLFYATNIYTLYIFTATWGFTNFQILYVFIPILTALYLKVLVSREKKFIFFFLLAAALSSVSFSNPAFALSLGIYFFLLTAALFIFRVARFDSDVFKKIAFLAAGSLLLNMYWMLPLAPQVLGGIQEINNST